MNQNQNYSFKNTVITLASGAFASYIFSYALDPIFSKLFNSISNIGTKFLSSFTDSIIIKIAKGSAYNSNPFSSTITFSVVLAIVVFYFLESRSNYFETLKKLDDINMTEPENESDESTNTYQNVSDVETEVKFLIKEFSSLKESISTLKDHLPVLVDIKRSELKKIYYMTTGIFIIDITSLVFFYSTERYALNESVTIENNIEIVSPYVSDVQYKELKSDFYSMKNIDDLNKLTTTLQSISEKHSIDLQEHPFS